jgi:hypothetical protein
MLDHLPSQAIRGPAPEGDRLSKRLEAFIARLSEEADRRIQRRATIETRWLEDLRQYHGIYDKAVSAKITERKGSDAYINLTAVKTDAMVARLWDLLFPTDDRNWSVEPTPVPELTEQAEAALKAQDEAKEAADASQERMQEAQTAGDPEAAMQAEASMRAAEQQEASAAATAAQLQAVLDAARRASDLMQKEIEDQLVTCEYAGEARDAIEDAAKIGIGILKGPVLGERRRHRWQPVAMVDLQGNTLPATGDFELVEEGEVQPAAYRVDPWHFFPDPDVRRLEDSDGVYERHLMSPKQLRQMAKQEGVDPAAVRALLKAGPDAGTSPTYLADLASLTGQSDGSVKDRFHVWEYSGPVESEELALLAKAFRDDDMALAMEEVDPLAEMHAKVFFCQGRVLRFAIHPLDSGEPIYSTFTIRQDEASVFGYGIPYIMRHPQSVLNGAYRMMMDNAALGTGPQIVVNPSVVKSQDGDNTLRPLKVWLLDTTAMQMTGGAAPFQTFNIDTHQQELAAIIGLASQTIDEVTAMPQISQGEQGTSVTKTAQGMAMLMSSANVGFRRIVRNFDDGITVPMIRRFYHWNMQFSPKPEIKGDYEVVARGSSVLLVREMQAQNLVAVATMFGDHPVYGPMIRQDELLKAIFRAFMISADQIVKSEREWKADMEAQDEGGDPALQIANLEADLKREEFGLREKELQAKVEVANMEADSKREVANLGFEAKMNALAEAMNMSREELEARLRMKGAEIDAQERGLAVETAMANRTGVSSGGAV